MTQTHLPVLEQQHEQISVPEHTSDAYQDLHKT